MHVHVCVCVRACVHARCARALLAVRSVRSVRSVRAQTFCGSFLASSWTISNTGDAGDQ